MRCEATFGEVVVVGQCERDAGHRPQVWHLWTSPEGGTVRWSFSDEEREAWAAKYGKGAA